MSKADTWLYRVLNENPPGWIDDEQEEQDAYNADIELEEEHERYYERDRFYYRRR